jgi:two-component system, OmpR family, response regulator VanR
MKTVMIVDDEKMTRVLISKVLKKEGYLVFDAADGDTALEMIREITPDIVIMDLMMPDTDGFTLAGELRRSTFLPAETRILLMSGFPVDHRQSRSSHCEINAYMNKPFNLVALVDMVSQLASCTGDLAYA